MLTMTVTGSLASPVASQGGEVRPARASGIALPFQKTTRGKIVGSGHEVEEVTESKRPTSSRRAALMQTASGQKMAAEARKDLAHAMRSHQVSQVAGLRMAAGLSQKELCELTGILQPHLSRLENGRVSTPELPTLQAMSSALGVSLDALVAAFVADTAAA